MRDWQALAALILKHTPGDGTFDLPIPRLGLVRSSTPTEPMHTLYPPSFCLVAQGRKEVRMGGQRLIYDRASFLVVGVDLPAIGAVMMASADEPYLCVRLELDRAILSEVIAARANPTADTAAAALATSAATPELIDATARLVALMETPGEAPYLAPLLEREIAHRLIAGPQGAMLRQIASGEGRLGRIDRAIRFIRESYREAFSIDQLASLAGMSHSAFHDHFRAVTGMTALQFRNHIRLQEARRLMVMGEVSAAAAGFAVGYDSPSQFSRDYTRLHRLPPARDAAQLRQHNIVAV